MSKGFDLKNPLNEQGKITKKHRKYYETTELAKKQMEAASKDLEAKNGFKAREILEGTYLLLDSLEDA